MEDWRRDYNEVRPHSAIGNKAADIAIEWLIGAPAGMSLTPEIPASAGLDLGSASNEARILLIPG